MKKKTKEAEMKKENGTERRVTDDVRMEAGKMAGEGRTCKECGRWSGVLEICRVCGRPAPTGDPETCVYFEGK